MYTFNNFPYWGSCKNIISPSKKNFLHLLRITDIFLTWRNFLCLYISSPFSLVSPPIVSEIAALASVNFVTAFLWEIEAHQSHFGLEGVKISSWQNHKIFEVILTFKLSYITQSLKIFLYIQYIRMKIIKSDCTCKVTINSNI